MTDLIERVDAAFSETAGDAPGQAAPESSRRDDAAGTTRPLHILLAVSLGGSAVLLFAMSSGHLHGARATAGIVAALAQVALAVGALTRPSRGALRRRGRRQRRDRRLLAGRRRPADGVRRDRRHRRGAVRRRRARGRGAGPAADARQRVVVGDLGHRLGRPRRRRRPGDRRPLHHDDRRGHPDGVEAVRHPGRLGRRAGALGHGQGARARTPRRSRASWPATPPSSRSSRSGCRLAPHDQAILTNQLSQALQAAERYPTVASAKAAHMILAGGMAPGVGAHYQEISADAFKGINPDGTVNPLYPGVVDLRQRGAQRTGGRGHVRVVRADAPRRGSSAPTTTGTGTPTCASSSAPGRSACPSPPTRT